MIDRKKYIEVLSKTVKTVKEFNEDAPIKISLECIEDILELLKEQEIVRCKDCAHWRELKDSDPARGVCTIWHTLHHGGWFCADGKRR